MTKFKLDKITIEIISLINQKKERKAFKVIVDTYNQQVYWHIRRMVLNHDDANDVLQNTYIKVWKSLSKFKGNSKMFTWLYRIATNESITFINKRKKQNVSLDTIQLKESQTNNQTVLMTSDTIKQKLYLAIETLPAKQRVIFNLKYFEELKYQEISKITSTSVGALKASYHHAVKKIEKYLKEN